MSTKTKIVKNVTKVLPRDFNLRASLNQKTDPDGFTVIPIDRIHPSPLEPQVKRRARILAEDLTELAQSITKHGLINPITVRQNNDGFEIVAGERRWMAAKQAGLDSISALVKNISDSDAEEIQLSENLDRKDLHPLDEAFWFKYLMDKPNATLTDVALKVGKNEAFVHQRLKLNELCEQGMADFAEGFLPIGHAMEIAKYPIETQKEILKRNCYHGDERQRGAQSLIEMKSDIERNILLKLKSAPFPLKNSELRKDKLICPDCSERTGFTPTLFEEDNDPEKDCCLNKNCFHSKTLAFIKIQIKGIKDAVIKDGGDEKHKVRTLTTWYSDGNSKEFPESLGRESYTIIEKKKDACKYTEYGVFVEGNRIGQKQLICPNKSCAIHKRYGYTVGMGKAKTEAEQKIEQENRRIRKEELFDIRVGEPVRRRVLKKSAEKFDAENTIFNHPQFAAEFQEALLHQLWKLQVHRSQHTAEVIREVLELSKDELSVNTWQDSFGNLSKLSDDKKSRLFFLLLTAYQDELAEGWGFRSQTQIKRIADKFDIDYQKLDAEERLAQAPMKTKDIFRDYLQQIEAGNRKAKIPRIWSENWKPKD